MIDPRLRISAGLNRARLRIEVRRALPAIPTLVVGAVLAAVGAAVLFSQLTPTLFKSTREVRLAIDDAYGILGGVDEVRYRGVPAGTISKIDREGTRLVLRVAVRKEIPLYRDLRAELRPETPLNDMHLDIVDPGTRATGDVGDDIVPETRTETSVKINDVLNTLRAPVRTRLMQLLDNFGNGLDDRGEALRTAFNAAVPFVANAEQVLAELAARERLTKRLVRNTGVLTEELGNREALLRRLIRDGSATLGTLNDGSSDIDAVLRQLPGVATEAQSSFTAVDLVVRDVDGALVDLAPVARRLPADLATIRRLTKALDPAVASLRTPVRALDPLALTLRPVARDLDRTVAALSPNVGSINKIAASTAKCDKAIAHFFQWNASLSKFGDVRGPIPRGSLAVNVPDSGVEGVRRRDPAENCAGGTTLDGRVPTKADEG